MKRHKLTKEYLPILHQYGLSHLPLEGLYLLHFDRGEYLYRSDTKPEYLMIVVEGRAKVCRASENGKNLMLAFYSGAGLMGEVELMLNSEVATSDAQVISPFVAVGIPLSMSNDLLSSPAFIRIVAQELARNVDHNSQNMVTTVLNPLEARLCSYISIMQIDGWFCEKLTVLAELMGTSYRHLLRTLNTLCSIGVLHKERNRYHIIDAPALKRLGGDMYQFTGGSERIPNR